MTASTEQPMPGAEGSTPKRVPNADIEKKFMIATMVIIGFLSLWTIRNVIVRPIDNFATQQVCRWHGIDTNQTVADYERSNQLGLVDRSDASCTLVIDAETDTNETIRIGSEEGQINPGPFYTLTKWFGVGFQILLTYGAVQAAMRALAYFRRGIDPGEWVLVVILVVLAILAMTIVRNVLVNPMDNLLAKQVCQSYGVEIGQPVEGSERADTFTLRGETEGLCQYGLGLNEEPPINLTLAEANPGGLYHVSKVFGVFLQLGAASLVLRFLVDPVFELYRSLRRKTSTA